MAIKDMEDLVKYLKSKDPQMQVAVMAIDLDDVRRIAKEIEAPVTDKEMSDILTSITEDLGFYEHTREYVAGAIAGFLQGKDV